VPACLANLDLAASLIDSAGNVVSTGATAGMGVTFSANLPGGTYYLRVEGIGVEMASRASTDYASLGQYTLTGTVVAAPIQTAGCQGLGRTEPQVTLHLCVLFSAAAQLRPDGSNRRLPVDFWWTVAARRDSILRYTYLNEGTYTATLTVTDDKGLDCERIA
jgi:hypothetical protein